MTGLLVSVRSAAEARVALAGGADVIDIKEPSRGALGPAAEAVWDEVSRTVAGRALVTAALGELLEEGILQRASAVRPPIAFAKIGLAGCHASRGWLATWFQALSQLDRRVQAVPVAYADWPAAGSPSPSVALTLAGQTAAGLLLIDTHDKSRGGLLDHISLETLADLACEARRRGVRLVLAGSLNHSSIRRVLHLEPAFVGVRGAACLAGRSGTVALPLVKALAALVKRMPGKAAG